MSWNYNVPPGVANNHQLSRELLAELQKRSVFFEFLHESPAATWTRFLWLLDDWWPTFHFGPCDHSECE